MRIHSFVFNWPGHGENAAALEAKLSNLCDVSVINSDETLATKHPHWVTLNNDAYFSEQWNKALELFAGDVLFHIQADAQFDQFDEMFRKYSDVRQRYRVGVFEPHIDHTDQEYVISGLRSMEPSLFEVPLTDSTCWFVEGSLIRSFHPIDTAINHYGWGVDTVIACYCRLASLKCLRDYTFTVLHPQGTGYMAESARNQMHEYFATLPVPMRKVIWEIFDDCRKHSVAQRDAK